MYFNKKRSRRYIYSLSELGILECSAIELIEHQIVVICIYRAPNGSSFLDIFFDKFESILDRFCLGKKKYIICGDINIDILKKDSVANKYESLILSYNLKCKIREPTRLECKLAWIICCPMYPEVKLM